MKFRNLWDRRNISGLKLERKLTVNSSLECAGSLCPKLAYGHNLNYGGSGAASEIH